MDCRGIVLDMVVCDVVSSICRRCSGTVMTIAGRALEYHGQRQQRTMACGVGGKRLASVMNGMLDC